LAAARSDLQGGREHTLAVCGAALLATGLGFGKQSNSNWILKGLQGG
jgi:hypothetical protein